MGRADADAGALRHGESVGLLFAAVNSFKAVASRHHSSSRIGAGEQAVAIRHGCLL